MKKVPSEGGQRFKVFLRKLIPLSLKNPLNSIFGKSNRDHLHILAGYPKDKFLIDHSKKCEEEDDDDGGKVWIAPRFLVKRALIAMQKILKKSLITGL